MTSSARYDDIRGTVADLLGSLARGDDECVERAVDDLVDGDGDGAASSVLVAAELLAHACGEMARALVGDVPAARGVTASVHGSSGGPIDIDDVPPEERAAIRGILAEANGNPSDSHAQLATVVANAGVTGLVETFVSMLTWTIDLTTSCDERGVAVPVWLAFASGWLR